MRPGRDESGAATVFGLGLMGVLMCLAVAFAFAVGVVATHRQAEAAADLAALAGAQAVQQGRDGCAQAAHVAARNGAALDRCGRQGFNVLVTVSVPFRAVPGHREKARARAGPEGGDGLS